VDAQVYNNTIFELDHGIQIHSVGSLDLKNNLIYQAATPLDIEDVSLTSVEADYNSLFPESGIRWMGTSIDHAEWFQLGFGGHDLLTDPRLVDPLQGNFDLAPDSPAVDAGLDVGLPFRGSAPDMGAQEGGEAPPQVLGDLNEDGVVSEIDLALCVAVALGEATDPDLKERADLNLDSDINAMDVQALANILVSRSTPYRAPWR
jgi:hypothetical protein